MSTGTVEFKVKITDDGSFKKLEISADDFNGAVRRIKSETDKLSSGLGKLSTFALGFNQIAEMAAKVYQALGKIVAVGASSELQKINLTTLFRGNAAAAEDMFKRISKYATVTVYDKEPLIEVQKAMMSYGVAGETAFATLKQIGDIAMGDSQKMQSLALAFAQASSLGKLMGNDYKQMVNAGFNPLQVISEKTGKSMETLQDEMSKGKIGVEQLAQAFQWATEEGGMFYKGAENAADATAGKINKLKGTWSEFLTKVFNELQPVINAVLDFATNVLEKIPAAIRPIRTAFGNVIDIVSDFRGIILGAAGAVAVLTVAVNASKVSLALQELVLNVLIVKEKIQIALTKAWAAAQRVLNLVMKANPIGLIIAAIALLVGAIAAVVRNTSGWAETWKSVSNYISKSLAQLAAWFKLKWLQIEDHVLSRIENIMRAWYKLQSIWDTDAADRGLDALQSKADERARAIAEQMEILEGRRQERQETTVTWSVRWERNSKKDEGDGAITPADIEDPAAVVDEPEQDPVATAPILSQEQFDLLRQHYDDLTKKQREMIDKGYDNLTEEEQRALKKRYDTLSASEKREADKQYKEAVKAAEEAQRERENALKKLYQDNGDKDAYELSMAQAAIDGLNEQLRIAQKYGKDTTKIQQQIADAQIELREKEFEAKANQLEKCLADEELALSMSLADREITQEQYDKDVLEAEERNLAEQLELYRQFGKDATDVMQQLFDKRRQLAEGNYSDEAAALQKNLDDTEISLKTALANNQITQDQYDRQMLAAKAKFYADMLELTRAYGKNDTQALKELLDAQLNLQSFDKGQKGKPFDTFTQGWGGLKGIGNSIRDIKSALTETDNAWDALTQTVDGFISLFQSMQQIVEIIETITAVTQTMQAVDDAATQQQLENDASKVAGNTAVAGTGAASAMASIPYVGPVLAIAAVASILATLATLPKFADGGLVYGPTLGLMGEYGGASSNPEVIAPLSKLRAMLVTDGGTGSSEVKFRIEGRELVGILNKQTNIYKRNG